MSSVGENSLAVGRGSCEGRLWRSADILSASGRSPLSFPLEASIRSWFALRAQAGRDARAPITKKIKKRDERASTLVPRQHDQAGYPDFSPSGLKRQSRRFHGPQS